MWYAKGAMVLACLVAVTLGAILASALAPTAPVAAQELGQIEADLIALADSDPAAVIRAIKAAVNDPGLALTGPEKAAFRDALLAAAFPGRDYGADETHVEEWERLRTALAPFQGKAGGQLAGLDAAGVFDALRTQLEVAPVAPTD